MGLLLRSTHGRRKMVKGNPFPVTYLFYLEIHLPKGLQYLQIYFESLQALLDLTWLENLVVGAVSHIQATEFYSDFVSPSPAHSESHFHHIGIGLLKNFLGYRNINC